jgi:hypothetical protein
MKEIIVKNCFECPLFHWYGRDSDEPWCIHPDEDCEFFNSRYNGTKVPFDCPLKKQAVQIKLKELD